MNLRRKSSLSHATQLALRIILLLSLLAFIVAVHWIERDSRLDRLCLANNGPIDYVCDAAC